MTARTLAALAVGDFRERVRRPVYAVTLLAAVGLGRLAVPAADSRWVVLDVGGNRGVYNSAWVGTATALAGALWLTVGGFYVVRGAIVRDAATRVGQVLAATPLRSTGYLAAKFLSNLLVLASMLGVLAGTALVLQLLAGEDRSVDPVALFAPFLLIALPPLAVTAAAAVLFETVPVLRAGFGNLLWFGLALLLAIGGQSAHAPLGGLGVRQAGDSLRQALEAQQLPYGEGGFSLGLTRVAEPLHSFRWDGAPLTGGFLVARLALVLLAAAAAVLPALWFGRFDQAAAASGTGRNSGAGNSGAGGGGDGDVRSRSRSRSRRRRRSSRAGKGRVRPNRRPGRRCSGRCRAPCRSGAGRSGGCWPGRRGSWCRACRAPGGRWSHCCPSPRSPCPRPPRPGCCCHCCGCGRYCCGPGWAPSRRRTGWPNCSVRTPHRAAACSRSGRPGSC
ncbi:hypothetical protein [Kitasatospora phosalacinea]|uniref:hypothetical protein n=1 Tax=Kitasatospora phosalacinea TaxID=2065 RepID=UPI000A695E8E|nr:hypothetical protein [Kitasatospora phosalacinea]